LSKIDEAYRIIRKRGIVRSKELDQLRIPREYLKRLCSQGLLEKIGHGIYTTIEKDATENHTMAIAAKRVPCGVVCLLSALRFHQLTTQNPFEVWMAIEQGTHQPKDDMISLQIVRFSGVYFSFGIEEHIIEKVPLRVYSIAKTVADAFRFRHKIGIDVALEALRECLKEKMCTIDELWRCAKICRAANIIRPYLESCL
jgi:predicted transcriptional regulator of viral defense system